MTMRKLRRLAIALSSAAALSIACGSTKNQGSLVLALETDVAVPQNVDGIGIAVSVDNQIKYSQLFSIDIKREQQGLGRVVKLPATIAVLEATTGSPAVQVRAVAFLRGEARIVRDVISTVPHGRTALLRLPLAYLAYEDGVTGTIPAQSFQSLPDLAAPARMGTIHLSDTTTGTGAATDIIEKISSRCSRMNLTNVDGECVDPTIDSATLPDYVEKDLFENGITAEGFANPEPCFDVGTCFAASATTTTQDLQRNNGECKVKLVGAAADLNVAMLLDAASADEQTGFPVDSATYVIPMSRDDAHGFRPDEAAGLVHLPKGVCERAAVVKMVLAHRAGCPQKTPLLPIAGAGANCLGTAGDGGTDAGTINDAEAGNVPPPAWWTAAGKGAKAAAVAVTSDGLSVLVATTDQSLYFVALDVTTNESLPGEGPVTPPGIGASTLAFIATDDEYVYTTYGTSDAMSWTFAAGAPPHLTFNANLSSVTTGIIAKVDTIMNPVTHCMGTGMTGTCFPAPNRLADNFPFMAFPGTPVSDQQSDITPTVAGAYAISPLGMEAYGAFNAPANMGGHLAVGKIASANFTYDNMVRAYAIAAVQSPVNSLVTSALTVSTGGLVKLAWIDPSSMKLTLSSNGPTIGPNDQTSYMHNLARDAAGYVYFTDNAGDLWSWNALAPTVAPAKMDATARVGSYGVAVDDVHKVVYRAFAGDAKTPGGVTRSAFIHP